MTIRRLQGSLLALLIASPLLAQLPNPTLNQIYPPGAAVGGQQIVTVSGRDLDQASRLLFSHPGIVGNVRTNAPGEFESEPTPIANQFDVEVSANVPPGRYEVRVVGRFGASTPRSFYIESTPVALEIGQHNSPQQPAELALNHVLFGRADANAVDYFQFEATKGQSFIIECLARAIDSNLQPVLTVFDSSGKQLRRSRETTDPVVEFTAPEDGSYLLGVNDHIYSGGEDFAYRLELRSQPYIAFVMPSVGLPGTSNVFQLIGSHLPEGTASNFKLGDLTLQQRTVRIFVPSHDEFNRRIGETRTHAQADFAFQWNSAAGPSNVVRIGLAEFPVTVEQADNDLPSTAQSITVPTEYVGQFYPRRDQDWVAFTAQKGQRYQVRVLSDRLGHFTDPEIYVQKVVTDAQGVDNVSQVSTEDDGKFDQNRYRLKLPRALDLSHQDPDVSFTADQDGTYRVGVRDLYGGSRDDPRLTYRLQICPQKNDFQLIAWTQRQAVDNDKKIEAASPVLRRGGNLPIYVDAIRRNEMSGPIELRVDGLPTDISAEPSTIAAGSSHGILILHASADAKAWAGPIQILGAAMVDGKSVERVAQSAVLLADTGDIQNSRPRSRLTRDFVLAVVDQDPAPVTVSLGQNVIETSRGAKLEIPVVYSKAAEVKGELALAAIVGSNEIKPKELKLAADAKDATLEVALNSDKIPLGSQTFFMRGKVKLAYARNPQAIQQAEDARKDFDAVMTELAAQEEKYTAELSTAKQAVAEQTARLQRFDGVQQAARKSLEAAVEASGGAVEQVQAFRAAATASGNDAEIAEVVERAHLATSQAVEQLKAARDALSQVSTQLTEVRAEHERSLAELSRMERAVGEVAEKRKRADAHKQALDKRIEESKKNFGTKDLNTWVDSSPVTLHIRKSPVQTILSTAELTPQAETTAELPFRIVRQFGFADSVQVELTLPDSAKGISAEAVSLAKEQTDGVLKITLGKDVAKGEHRCSVKTKLKFNDLSIEDETSLVLQIK